MEKRRNFIWLLRVLEWNLTPSSLKLLSHLPLPFPLWLLPCLIRWGRVTLPDCLSAFLSSLPLDKYCQRPWPTSSSMSVTVSPTTSPSAYASASCQTSVSFGFCFGSGSGSGSGSSFNFKFPWRFSCWQTFHAIIFPTVCHAYLLLPPVPCLLHHLAINFHNFP